MRRSIAFGLKRAFDVALSAVALVVLSPLIALIGLAILAIMGRPVFFHQPRLGLHGKPFVLYKFRSMEDRRGDDGELLPDEQRLTRVGRLLRSVTLDEVPEALNVLRGDMSIVGPRPLRVEYRDFYNEEQWRRHDMRPGMAGPVLAKGRNTLSWDDKFGLDVRYVDEWSLWLDAKIIVQTTLNIFKRKGISADDHATMPWFQGSDAKRAPD